MVQNHFHLFFAGASAALAIHHFLVWTGRRHDLRNLAFSLLNVGYITFVSGSFNGNNRALISYLIAMIISIMIPFLASNLQHFIKDRKRVLIVSLLIILLLNICTLCLYLLLSGHSFFVSLNFFISLVITMLANSINASYLIEYNEYKDKNKKVFLLGFFLIISSAVIFIVLFTFWGIPGLTVYYSFFLDSSLLTVLFIFAYSLAHQFNREHRELEALTATLEQKIEERTKQLNEANKQKTQFFINLAHETKTPLTLIGNYFREYVKEKGTDFKAQVIESNLEKLKQDMINYLDFEKLTSGQIFYNHHQTIDFSGLVQMQLLLFAELARIKNIALKSQIEENLFLESDPLAAERIINNLLDNAVKYTDAGGRITVVLKVASDIITLLVADTGPGIPLKQQEHIFKPFYQLSHHKRNAQGIGMGLLIVKTLVAELKGSVHLESIEGAGTCFTLTLPRTVPGAGAVIAGNFRHATLPPSFPDKRLPVTEYSKDKATLFLVEDNREMLYYLQSKLLAAYNVFYAFNGKEALSKIAAVPRPDLILSDIMMDTMDGFTFYEKLKAKKEFADIPLIFLTAHTSTHDKITSLHKGAVDYIYKPFDIHELMGKIGSILKIRNALKRANLQTLGERLFHYLDYDDKKKARFTDEAAGKKDSYLKQLYENFNISRRQVEILALLKLGLERKEITEKLQITMNTLKIHMRRLFDKCKVNNKTELLNIFY